MRIFVIWPDESPEVLEAVLKLKEDGHEIVYWAGPHEEGIHRTKLPGTIFHEHYAAWAGNPSHMLDDVFEPPDEMLILECASIERIVLHMMSKRFDLKSVDERRHLFYRMLGYWHGVLAKYRPNAVVFSAVPHTVYNYILYELARRRSIKTVMFEDSWVSDRLLKYTDFREGSRELRQAIEKNRGRNFSVEDLSEDLRAYYESHASSTSEVPPIYTAHWRKSYGGIRGFIRKLVFVPGSIKDGSIFRKTYRSLTKRIRPNLRREYLSFVQPPDFSKPYVYLPLSYQPERSTSPQGDIFVDQLLVVEIVAAALPPGWELYVKEHPFQWWARTGITYSSVRYPKYYEHIAGIPHTRLVPIATNSFSLASHSHAVAVVNGTAGWEGLLREKPTLIFGYPWYRDCPGVVKVASVASCREALTRIAAGFRPTPQEMINYLKSFDEATTHGYIERFVDRVSKLNYRENVTSIFRLIREEVSSRA